MSYRLQYITALKPSPGSIQILFETSQLKISKVPHFKYDKNEIRIR